MMDMKIIDSTSIIAHTWITREGASAAHRGRSATDSISYRQLRTIVWNAREVGMRWRLIPNAVGHAVQDWQRVREAPTAAHTREVALETGTDLSATVIHLTVLWAVSEAPARRVYRRTQTSTVDNMSWCGHAFGSLTLVPSALKYCQNQE